MVFSCPLMPFPLPSKDQRHDMKGTQDEQERGEGEDAESAAGGEISQGEKSRDFISLCWSNVAVLGCFPGVPGRFRKPSSWNSLPAVCLLLRGSISIAPGLILQGHDSQVWSLPVKRRVRDAPLCKACQEWLMEVLKEEA